MRCSIPQNLSLRGRVVKLALQEAANAGIVLPLLRQKHLKHATKTPKTVLHLSPQTQN